MDYSKLNKKTKLTGVIKSFLLKIKHITVTTFFKLRGGKFSFSGKECDYFFHPYNNTWKGERRVEIPIALDFIEGIDPDKILEVGNTLSHYFKISHDVLDKYENKENIINKDIVGFKSDKKYDRIVSISTLEHIGFDEPNGRKEKILDAVKWMRKFLSKDGETLITVPLKYNPFLDLLIKRGDVFDESRFMRRVSWDYKWKECSKEEAFNSEYNSSQPPANIICVGKINRRGDLK